MGLGKTIQTAAFVNILATKINRPGPVLVVVPLSTAANWMREFQRWTDLNTILYHGSAADRRIIRELEMAYGEDRPKGSVGYNQSFLAKCTSHSTKPWMVQVVVTTPEMMIAEDAGQLSYIKWELLVVDESHRLKNHNSKVAVGLRDEKFKFNHKVLLTGTPIQVSGNITLTLLMTKCRICSQTSSRIVHLERNQVRSYSNPQICLIEAGTSHVFGFFIREFWALLNFIDPSEFESEQDFIARYGDLTVKDSIDEMHERIRPYILRRLKEDVETSVPPKEETLIEVELSLVQKQYYRAIYEKNVQFLCKKKGKAIDGPSLLNLHMEVRKKCGFFQLVQCHQLTVFRRRKASKVLQSSIFD